MRTFTDGNGNDSTAAALAYIQAQRELRLVDLYLIGEQEDPNAVFVADWESPLAWPIWGTFQTSVISRGKVTSQVGLKVDTLDVTWSPRLTAFGTSISTANFYQKARAGYYDNMKFRLWRGLMPTPGDLMTYGACEWFGGRVAQTITQRSRIKFTINSFLDVVNQKVPPNVIELGNALAGWVGNVPVLADGETSLPTFTVVAPSTPNIILGDCIQPTAHKIYGTDKFIHGFIVFDKSSSLAGFWSPVATNIKYNAGGSVHYNQFQIYAALPWAPTPGDVFYASTQWPVDLASAQAMAAEYFGFPFVPDPTMGI